MPTTDRLTISLPSALSEQLEKVRRKENRTPSELITEALRQYIESRYPSYTPTPLELAGIRLGRAEIKRGEFVTLNELTNGLDPADRKPRKKSTRKVPG